MERGQEGQAGPLTKNQNVWLEALSGPPPSGQNLKFLMVGGPEDQGGVLTIN